MAVCLRFVGERWPLRGSGGVSHCAEKGHSGHGIKKARAVEHDACTRSRRRWDEKWGGGALPCEAKSISTSMLVTTKRVLVITKRVLVITKRTPDQEQSLAPEKASPNDRPSPRCSAAITTTKQPATCSTQWSCAWLARLTAVDTRRARCDRRLRRHAHGSYDPATASE
eukprot:1081286-Pleurochrysis_carterae.AAC.1